MKAIKTKVKNEEGLIVWAYINIDRIDIVIENEGKTTAIYQGDKIILCLEPIDDFINNIKYNLHYFNKLTINN
jgi:hypothetical protein